MKLNLKPANINVKIEFIRKCANSVTTLLAHVYIRIFRPFFKCHTYIMRKSYHYFGACYVIVMFLKFVAL